MFDGIDILAHIPHINPCQIPVGFVLLIFDLPIGTRRSKTKIKKAFLKWFLDVKNGPPFLSFGGFQKRVAIFSLVILLERGTRDKNKNAIFVIVFDVTIGNY